MVELETLRHWSHARQLLGRRGGSLPGILRLIVGVYSSHPSGPLSLHTRSRKLTARSFAMLEADRKALRVAAMRLSTYMLPAETARLAVAATTPAPNDPFWEKRYSVKGRTIPKKKYPPWRKKVLEVARQPLTIAEIREAAGLPDEAAKPVLNRMAFEGNLLRVGASGLRSNALRYVTTRRWHKEHRLPGKEDRKARNEALVWLAAEYMRAFGPARIADFRWWAGITATSARKAVGALEMVEVGDDLECSAYLIDTEDGKIAWHDDTVATQAPLMGLMGAMKGIRKGVRNGTVRLCFQNVVKSLPARGKS